MKRYRITGIGLKSGINEPFVDGMYNSVLDAQNHFIGEFGKPNLFITQSQFSTRLNRFLRIDTKEVKK